MSTPGYILALDQGTTGTTAMLVDSTGMPLWSVNREIRQIYPRPGWVEHDPVELFESCLHTVEELLEMAEAHPRSILALGIARTSERRLFCGTGAPESRCTMQSYGSAAGRPLCATS